MSGLVGNSRRHVLSWCGSHLFERKVSGTGNYIPAFFFADLGNFTQLTATTTDIVNEPRHEKTCLRGFRPGKTQTGLLSYRDKLEA